MRSRLNELVTHLQTKKSALNIEEKHLDAWMENGETKNAGCRETVNGINIFNFSYSGVIFVEGLEKKNLSLLMLLVQIWLYENDEKRADFNLANPKYQLIDIDPSTMDVEITIDFIDEFYIGKDEAGGIDYNGDKYLFDSYDLWVAEELTGVEGTIVPGGS